MARNKFDVDEELESPFDIRHLKRALKYAAKYKGKIALSLLLSMAAAVIALFAPVITQHAIPFPRATQAKWSGSAYCCWLSSYQAF